LRRNGRSKGDALAFTKSDLLDYMQSHQLAVVSSVGEGGTPQSALVGIAVTSAHDVIFDTVSDSRKHRNLARDPRTSIVFSGPSKKTLQLEGVSRSLAVADDADAELREIYFAVWPDGRDRLRWPNIAYWCVSPRWARYSDFQAGPLIKAFDWPAAPRTAV
jgi:general stress protein 26